MLQLGKYKVYMGTYGLYSSKAILYISNGTGEYDNPLTTVAVIELGAKDLVAMIKMFKRYLTILFENFRDRRL